MKKKKKKQELVMVRVPHPDPACNTMQKESTHVLICTKCQQRRYVDERFLLSFKAVEKKQELYFQSLSIVLAMLLWRYRS